MLRNPVLRTLLPRLMFSWTSEDARRVQEDLLASIESRVGQRLPWAPNPGQIPATSFVGTLAVNANNPKLSDAAFREFVCNTLPIVEGSDVVNKVKP